MYKYFSNNVEVFIISKTITYYTYKCANIEQNL